MSTWIKTKDGDYLNSDHLFSIGLADFSPKEGTAKVCAWEAGRAEPCRYALTPDLPETRAKRILTDVLYHIEVKMSICETPQE